MRVAVYARYSSDNQRDASIEDQIRICRERCEQMGWNLVEVYSDHSISGASLILRPAIQQLMQDAMQRKYDLVMAEALDRLSRDQEEIAGVFKRLGFFGAKMFTLSEGEISELHIGLKGTMNALFLKDLAAKTRRGMRGRVEKGKSGGGVTYGYDVVKRIGDDGEYARGERAINEFEAEIVRGIFSDYVKGISPRAIAASLNKRCVAAPTGGEWGASTIYGNRERGTGILNNEIYVGRLVWNRLTYLKDPSTGKRVSRPNPDSEIIRQDVPELRIVDQDVWDRVKAMQGAYNKRDMPLWTKNRPKSLFGGGLTRCGCCRGGFTTMAGDRLGCAAARNKGTCQNKLTIKRDTLEASVLTALRDHLMDEQLCDEFCKAYTARINELRIHHNASLAGYRAELAKLERERQQIIRSIADGVPGSLLKDRAIIVQNRREELEALLETTKEAPVLFHPNMASRYHKEIRNLIASLNDPGAKAEAGLILRSLIDSIILTPKPGSKELAVDLVGDLAGILAIATNRGSSTVKDELSKLQPVNETGSEEANPAENGHPEIAGSILAMVAGNRTGRHSKTAQEGPDFGASWAASAMVAGARFELTTFRL